MCTLLHTTTEEVRLAKIPFPNSKKSRNHYGTDKQFIRIGFNLRSLLLTYYLHNANAFFSVMACSHFLYRYKQFL